MPSKWDIPKVNLHIPDVYTRWTDVFFFFFVSLTISTRNVSCEQVGFDDGDDDEESRPNTTNKFSIQLAISGTREPHREQHVFRFFSIFFSKFISLFLLLLLQRTLWSILLRSFWVEHIRFVHVKFRRSDATVIKSGILHNSKNLHCVFRYCVLASGEYRNLTRSVSVSFDNFSFQMNKY